MLGMGWVLYTQAPFFNKNNYFKNSSFLSYKFVMD